MPEVSIIEEVFNTEGAAAFLDVGEGYVRKHWEAMGGVDLGHGVGYRFRKSKLLDWLDAHAPERELLDTVQVPSYSRAKSKEPGQLC